MVLIYNMDMVKNDRLNKIISAIFIIVWMIFVFVFSSQDGDESSHTSRGTVDKIVSSVVSRTKVPESKKQEIIDWANPIVRKVAHYTEYAIGGILIINFITLFKIGENRAIIYSVVSGMFYAITDEIHQLFVLGRSSQVVDVFIDSLGVATGVVVFMIIQKIIAKFKKTKKIKEGET